MGSIAIKGLTIGAGVPKVVIPLVGNTTEQILQEAELVKSFAPDIVEWRSDLYEQVDSIEKVLDLLAKLRSIFSEEPLLFTFRSHREGGNREFTDEQYKKLNEAVICSGNADLVDIELFSKAANIKELIAIAKEKSVFVVMSNHDFRQTPDKAELLLRLRKMSDFGADILKIAVMPQSVEDVLTLLAVTNEVRHESDCPIVTMAMGKLGVISRLAGEVFGSAFTFGTVQAASAPGQIPVADLRNVLNIIHQYGNE